MLCQIIHLDDSVCDNGYCYYRYISYEYKDDKVPGVCDFCEETQVFYKGENSFCSGMCMDKYNKCKDNETANRLFVDLKKYKQYKNKFSKMIKQIEDEITCMIIV